MLTLKDAPDVMGIREAAEILRISPITLKRWANKNKIKCVRVGKRGDRKFKKKDLQEFLGL